MRSRGITLPLPPWGFGDNLGNLYRLLLAVLWTFLWGSARWLAIARKPATWRYYNAHYVRLMAFTWDRRVSPAPVVCRCGWTGPLRWAIHTYQDDGCDDVEPVDECPRCGHGALQPARWRGRP